MKLREALGHVAESVNVAAARTNELLEQNASAQELIRHFSHVSAAYDALNDTKKLLNAEYDRLSREVIPDALKKEKVKFINLEDVGRVAVSYRFSASILDKDKAYEYLRANNAGSLITSTVNSSALSAYAKELLVGHGKELPPELFKVSTSPYTSITRR